MNIYGFDQYKPLLKAVALEKRELLGSQFTLQNLARACGVQKTYLSKMFSDPKTHLSEDQLYRALRFLGFKAEEMEYIELLFRRERAQVPERAALLQKKVEALRATGQKSESSLSQRVKDGGDEKLTKLFLDPYFQLVTVFLTLERYREKVERIQRCLQISRAKLNSILLELEQMGIIAIENGRYKVIRRSFHLPADSPLQSAYRTALRIAALDRLQSQTGDYSFSVVFSASPAARAKIQARFLEFLKEAEGLSRSMDAKEARVFQINFDLLGWDEPQPA